MAVDFNFTRFTVYPNLFFYIMRNDGLLMIQDESFTSEDEIFIYNQSETGFNYIDWLAM